MISWNVNGLQTLAGKGFTLAGFSGYFYCTDKKGYSGVAIYSRMAADKVDGMGEPRSQASAR